MFSKLLANTLLALGAILPVSAVRWIADRVGRLVFYIPSARRGLLLNARRILGESSTQQARRELAVGRFASTECARGRRWCYGTSSRGEGSSSVHAGEGRGMRRRGRILRVSVPFTSTHGGAARCADARQTWRSPHALFRQSHLELDRGQLLGRLTDTLQERQPARVVVDTRV